MFLPYTETVNQFCDDQDRPCQHNPDAPNMQNALCKQRSICEVISQHADFKDLRKPNPSKPIQVTFKEVQQKDDLAQRVVPALDVSASVIEGDRTYTTANRTGVSLQIMSRAATDIETFICHPAERTVHVFDDAIIYATLNKGRKVFVDALVFAEVTLQKGYQAKLKKSKFRLYDNGDVPDTCANDGTYSGYFSKFNGRGRYEVYVHLETQVTTRLQHESRCRRTTISTEAMFIPSTSMATSLHAASEDTVEDEDFIVVDPNALVPRTSATNVGQPVRTFFRVISCGDFKVEEDIFESQVPPADIYDLRARNSEPGPKGTLLVSLMWTWPGAHLYSENASSIEIRASKEPAKLKASFENGIEITEHDVVEGEFTPLPPGAKHTVRLALPAAFSSPQSDGVVLWDVYLVARVSNSDGLTSISNIARTWFDSRFVLPTEETSNNTDNTCWGRGNAEHMDADHRCRSPPHPPSCHLGGGGSFNQTVRDGNDG
ncbi:calcium-activated chloride channel regulator 3A-1-like [Haemaphysalis longicornis]